MPKCASCHETSFLSLGHVTRWDAISQDIRQFGKMGYGHVRVKELEALLICFGSRYLFLIFEEKIFFNFFHWFFWSTKNFLLFSVGSATLRAETKHFGSWRTYRMDPGYQQKSYAPNFEKYFQLWLNWSRPSETRLSQIF